MKNTKKGFTLVELLVVIAILAILATVSIVGYTSFIDRSNISVDEQFVAQLNNFLEADEIGGNKPATVVDVKAIFEKNEVKNYDTHYARNTIYWVASENRVILWTAESVGAAEGKVTYPAEYAEKYSDYTEPSTDWKDLNAPAIADPVVPAEGQSLEAALIEKLQGLGIDDHAVVTLPENSTLTMTDAQLDEFYGALKTAEDVGKDITIDLNGSTWNAISTDGYQAFIIPNGATLEIVDGDMSVKSGHAGFQVNDGGSLVLRNIAINNSKTYSLFFPSSTASEVILENCTIKGDRSSFGMMTNGMTSENIRVVIKGTTFETTATHAVLMNVASNVHIENSTIVGSKSALTMRAGSVEVINSTLKSTSTAGGIYQWQASDIENYLHGKDASVLLGYGYWGQGNIISAGTITLGDHSKSNNPQGDSYSYQGDVACRLENVTIETTANDIPDILIASRAMKNVTLTCDSATAAKVQLYNWPHEFGHGTVIVNGVEQTFTDDKQ